MTETLDTTNNNGNTVPAHTAVARYSYEELTAKLASTEANLESTTKLLALARARVTLVEADWTLLNAKMNEYAEEADLCDEYESRIARWNGDFSAMELEGRYKTYTVRTKVEVTYYVDVEVEAKDSDDAINKVDNLDSDEIHDAVDNEGWSDYDDMTWDARDAQASD